MNHELVEFDEEQFCSLKFARRSAHSTQIESTLAGSIYRIQRLTPSILDRAFRGELVPQDPDNEPAEELLNRINDNKATCSRRAKRARIQKVQV